MYQALYRKYRPTNFDEVVGQDVIIRTLKNAILNDKISHAYLFAGPRGTGKTTIAKILAKVVNCENLTNLNPCNKCDNCMQIISKQSTDIVEIDAASNNGVDEIREIRNKVNLVPSIGKYKVYIIDEVHMLTVGAFNALLKTLEEPPSHVIFILATTEPHKIPLTILSRCQKFDFKRIPTSKLVERLKTISNEENIDITEDALFEIARLSEGGMRDSISTLDQVLSYADDKITIEDVHEVNGTLTQDVLSNFVDNIINKNILEVLKSIDNFNDLGKNISKLSEEIIILLKNILISKNVEKYFDESHNTTLYKKLGNNIDNNSLIALIDIFNEGIVKIKQSSDPKLILELLVIKYISNISDMKNKTSRKLENSKQTNVCDEQKEESIKKIYISAKDESESIKLDENIKTENNRQELSKSLDDIVKIRVNNTLAGFNKKHFVKVKEELENIKDLLLIPEYSQIISTILDGNLKAASEKNLIFVYDTINLANYFNENIILIEELLEKNYNTHYDVIGVDNDSWEIIKRDFNSKTKQYKYQKENFDIYDLLKKNDDTTELNNLFGEIVEVIN